VVPLPASSALHAASRFHLIDSVARRERNRSRDDPAGSAGDRVECRVEIFDDGQRSRQRLLK
jgi:hypothetical protein